MRPLDQLTVITRLSEIGMLYHQKNAPRPSNVELYTLLFTQALFPPTRVTDPNDPYSLAVQIEELVYALSSAAFIDFSIVEMRIRLGQMLWGFQNHADEDDILMDGESEDESNFDKEWLLLQILLSCELLIRLDLAIKDAGHPEPVEIHLFNNGANLATKWGLVVARRWLDNILIKIPEYQPVQEKRSSWLSYLTGAARASEDDSESLSVKMITFESRHADLQLSGLISFAQKICWGKIAGLESRNLTVCVGCISFSRNFSCRPSIFYQS